MIIYYKQHKTGEYSVVLSDGGGFNIELDCHDLESAKTLIDSVLDNCMEIMVSSPEIPE